MKLNQKELISRYESLSPVLRGIVQVAAVVTKSIARTDLVSLASKAGIRHADGSRPQYMEIRDELNAVIDAGVLHYENGGQAGRVCIAAQLADYAFREAF